MRRIHIAMLALGGLLATSCSGGQEVDLTPVTDAITAIESAQTDLRSRMSDIESSVQALGSATGDPDAASGLLEQLDAIDTRIAEVQAALDQLATETAAEDEDLRNLLAELESTLSGVSTSLSTLRSDITKLREDHELLRQRFDSHLQDHS